MTARQTCSLLILLPLIFPAVHTGSAFAAEAGPGFQVGYARRDVTPKEPVPMWGYGARHAALSQGALDPLYADAVVIEAGGKTLAIVGLDLGRSPSEQTWVNVRRRIEGEAGVEFAFIAGSHTHHGPVLELTDEKGMGKGKFDAALRYYQELEDLIVAVVALANADLTPATMATGSIRLDGFNRNRHTKREPKPVDRELAVMRFDDSAGKTKAVVVNFAAHPTMIPAAGLRFSADFVGSLKESVGKTLGCGVVFMQGASGDLSVNQGKNKGHQAYGEALGREVVRLAGGLKPAAPARPALEVREERLEFASRVDFSSPAVRLAYNAAFFPELVANYYDEYADGVRPRLTVALLNGNVALVGVSGEVFCSHAIRLKERARVKQLFLFGYCNGYHQYFPTIEAAAEGGYGADSLVAPAEVGAGETLMNTSLIWLYQMMGRI